ncbi:MAG: WD40 repeat domain-containing protein [Anaerolineaceae bacterium]|nr:WD40 repeat domain-containing protein [Anaerolineaceae bacterium]
MVIKSGLNMRRAAGFRSAKTLFRLLLPAAALLVLVGCQAATIRPNISPAPTASAPAAAPSAAQTAVPSAAPSAAPQETMPQFSSLPSFGRGVIQDFRWARDGSSLLTVTTQGIYIHDPKTLQLKSSIPVPAGTGGNVSFAADGTSLIIGTSDSSNNVATYHQWNSSNGAVTRPIYIREGEVEGMAASPDGNLLAVLSASATNSEDYQGSVRLWDIKTGRLVRTLFDAYDKQTFSAVTFSPDSRWVAVGCTDAVIYLWNLQTDSGPLKLIGHTSYVTSLAFSPDGRLLVSGGKDASVRLWEMPTGTLVKTIMEFKGDIKQVEISADGHRLAAVDETGQLKLWQLQANLLPEGTSETLNIQVQVTSKSFAISPQGDVAAVMVGDALGLWSISTQQWLAKDPYYGALWESIAWSPDGKTLFGNSSSQIVAWDAQTGTILRESDASESGVRSLRISQDGSLLAATDPYQFPSNQESISIIDAHSGALLNRLVPTQQLIVPPVMSPDGRWLAANYGDKIGIWDPRAGKEILTIPSTGTAFAFSGSSDQLIVFDQDGYQGGSELQVWDVLMQTKVRSIPIGGISNTPQASVANGSLAALAIDQGMPENGALKQLVEVWDMGTGRLRFQVQTDLIDDDEGLAFSPDGSMLAISGYSQLQIAATSNGDLLASAPLSSAPVKFSPDGNMLAAGGDILQRWEVSAVHRAALENRPQKSPTPDLRPTQTPTITPTAQSSLEITPLPIATGLPGAIRSFNAVSLTHYAQLGQGSVVNLAWSPDGKTLAAAGSLGVYLYEGSTLNEIQHFEAGQSTGNVTFSPDGKLLAAGELGEIDPFDGSVISANSDSSQLHIWDLATHQQIGSLKDYTGGLAAIHFSSDGRKLLFRAEKDHYNQLELWDISAGKTVQSFTGGNALFSPDGQYVFSDSGTIWRVQDGVIVFKFPDRKTWIISVDWSADGLWTALGYQDGVVQIWNMADITKPVLSHTLQVGIIQSGQWPPIASNPEVQFSPDGALLATTSQDNSVRIWDTGSGDLLSEMTGGANSPRFSPDGKRLATITVSDQINIWRVAADGMLSLALTQSDHSRAIVSAAFSPDGKYILSGNANSFRQWPIDQPHKLGAALPEAVRVIQTFESDNNPFWGVHNVSAVDPVNSQLVSGHIGGEIRVWDAKSGQLVKEFTGSQDFEGLNGFPYISQAVFSPDGKLLASIGAVGDLRIWNAQSWDVESDTKTYENLNPVFSPDGRFIAASQDLGGEPGFIRIFDTLSGRELRSFPGGGVLAFSANGVQLLSNRNWIDLRSGKVAATFASPSDASISSAAVNPSGDVLLLGRSDGVIEVWDIANARLLTRLVSGTQGVATVSFSKDGRFVLAGNKDGSIGIWSLNGN